LGGSPGGNYGTGFNQPGTLGESAYDTSVFFQHNINFTPKWSLLYGVRGDMLFDDIFDPLPLPGYAPVSDNTVQLQGSGNASINYKPESWMTDYLTFSYSESAPGNTGGGYSYFTPNNN
jgi:hypothetical protein